MIFFNVFDCSKCIFLMLPSKFVAGISHDAHSLKARPEGAERESLELSLSYIAGGGAQT